MGRTPGRRLAGTAGIAAILLTTLVAVPASSSEAAGSCQGFRNRTGITSHAVTIANVSDVTGPIPGLHSSAQQAVKAYVAYFNANSSICGRKLRLLSYDTGSESSGDRTGYQAACSRAFAAIGSMSMVDDGGVRAAQRCGLPDLRAQASTAARYACTTCFATEVVQPNAWANAIPDFFLTHDHAATQSAAFLYLNDGSVATRARTALAAERKRGFDFVYTAPISVAEFNYVPYVEQLISKHVQLVQFAGPAQQARRLAQTMHDRGFTPAVFLAGDDVYTPSFARAGVATAGTYVPIDAIPLEQASTNAELHRYKHWLHVVAPSAVPTIEGLYAWSSARLFTEQARALGGRLTRAHLITALTGVRRWTDHGAHARQDVGGRNNGNCWRFLRVSSGRWAPVGGTSYLCTGKTLVPPA